MPLLDITHVASPQQVRRRPYTSIWLLPAVALVGALLLAGCSRLSFVRPDVEREDYEQIAREVNVRDAPEIQAAANARSRVRAAQQHLGKGDFAAADKEARAALKLDPGSEVAHTLLGAIHDRQGDRRKAGEHYQRAAELAPRNGAVLNNYGTWLCGNGRVYESLAWFDRAVADRAYPSPALALANAGACSHRAGLDDEAQTYLTEAIKRDPRNPVALGVMAERSFKAGNAFEARAFSERRLSAAPATAEALLLASQIEQKLGDTDAAARYVQRMRAEFPNASGSEAGDGGRQ